MKTYIAEPNPNSLIESIRDIGYTLETAVADLIDNSISASASIVEIYSDYDINERNIRLAILDDGIGLEPDELYRALTIGNRSPKELRDIDDLGRFGLGLKTASFSQCRKLTVISRTETTIAAAQWDLDFVVKENSWSLKVFQENECANFYHATKLIRSGTLIIWEDCDRILDVTSDSFRAYHEKLEGLEAHLKLTFHRYIEGKKLSISINGNKPIPYYDPFATKFESTQKLPDEIVQIGNSKVLIKPFVLPHHSKISPAEYEANEGQGGYIANQGFYVYRNKRLLVHGTWFRMRPKSDLSKLTRIMIDLPNNLDDIWKIDVKKSSASPPQIIRDKLKSIIDKISEKSVRVYKSRGSKQSSVTDAYWFKEHARGKISYSINDGHPNISDFMKTLSENQREEFKLILSDIAAFFPVDLFYADYGSSPSILGQNNITDEELEERARDQLEKNDGYFDVADFLKKFNKVEPYVHYTKSWEVFINEYNQHQ